VIVLSTWQTTKTDTSTLGTHMTEAEIRTRLTLFARQLEIAAQLRQIKRENK